MASPRPAGLRPPWLVAVIMLVVAVVLAVVFFVLVYPHRNDDKTHIGTPALSPAERAAMTSARVETLNLLTYARKSFDADWARAMAGTTGQLKSDLKDDKAKTLKQLTKNKFDLTATVSDVALEGGTVKDGLQVLVVASGHRVDDKGNPSAAIANRLELTMKRVDGKWLASDLQGIDLS